MKLLLFITSFASLALFSGPEINEWRGSGRTGVYPDKNLLDEWPAEGPAEILKIENIGNGFVSPVFAGERLFISGEIDSMSILFCFDLKGNKIWQAQLGKEWTRSCRGSRSAPTVAGDLLYIGNGFGDLYCVRSADGKVVWSKDLARDFAGVLPLHGHSAAPLVDGDLVFWMTGGKEINMVALNRFTGRLVWKNQGFGEVEGYNSPKLIELPSGKIVVTFSAYHLMGFDAATGKLLWSQEQDNIPPGQRKPGQGDTHSNTVLYEGGSIYYVAGDGNGGVRLRLSADGKSVSQVWRNTEFDSFMGGTVKVGSYLYGCGTAKPMLWSVNADSGSMADSLRIGSGAVISADNKLFYYTQKGDIYLVAIDNGRMKVKSSFRLRAGTMQHFAHPVINKGILYQRHGTVLVGYDIMEK
jgi:outer membrane protein assembly factor BamB